jgi:hypothetical protein
MRDFTLQQADHICYQIGEWYLKWKNCIVDGLPQGQHRLGIAKEDLKMMICGDKDIYELVDERFSDENN